MTIITTTTTIIHHHNHHSMPTVWACYDANEAYSLEGLIDRSVPAEEGTGCEEDEPEDGETKVDTFIGVPDEEGKAGKNVEEQSHTVH